MKKIGIAVICLGIAAGGYAAYRYTAGNQSTKEQRISSDSEDAVYVNKVADILGTETGSALPERFGGKIEPQAIWKVKLESEQKVKKCLVKEGERVEEGQILFSYDTQESEDKLAQTKIDIERAKGENEVSNRTLAQLEKEKKAASADEQLSFTTQILTEQNNIKVNEYEIKSKELEIEQLQDTIDNAQVHSEMAGVVQKISDPNNLDDGGVYMTIMADGDYRVKCTINEQNLSAVYEEMPVIVHSRVEPDKTWKGTVTEIQTGNGEAQDEDNGVVISDDSAGSSNYTFYVTLDGMEGMILGQHVYLEEDRGQEEARSGIWLDEGYLVTEDGADYVWMANEKNQITKQKVEVGERDEEQLKCQILSGLSEDDYIMYPSDTVQEGLPVIYNDYGQDDAGLDKADLDEAGLDEADLDEAGLDEAGLDNADLDDTDLDEADPEDTNLADDAELTGKDAKVQDNIALPGDGAGILDNADLEAGSADGEVGFPGGADQSGNAGIEAEPDAVDEGDGL